MSAYLIGNLVGRFIASYLLVLAVNLLMSRFRLRVALGRTHRPWGWVMVVLVFVLGLLGRIV